MVRENRLKSLIQSGGHALGCWTSMDNPITTEILAQSGFDFLLIDHEHGYGDSKGLAVQLQAMASSDAASVVRVPDHDPAYFKRILDTGVDAVMVPGVNSVAEAEQVVDAVMFPPVGSRGLAPGVIRASTYGINAPDYVKSANDNLYVICQIETAAAVDNIDAIAAVDGIDMLFVGPNDLSASIGKFGQFTDPEVKELIEGAERKILAAGKAWGSIPYGPHSWQDMFARGCNLTTAGTEVALLKNAAVAITDLHKSTGK